LSKTQRRAELEDIHEENGREEPPVFSNAGRGKFFFRFATYTEGLIRRRGEKKEHLAVRCRKKAFRKARSSECRKARGHVLKMTWLKSPNRSTEKDSNIKKGPEKYISPPPEK